MFHFNHVATAAKIESAAGTERQNVCSSVGTIVVLCSVVGTLIFSLMGTSIYYQIDKQLKRKCQAVGIFIPILLASICLSFGLARYYDLILTGVTCLIVSLLIRIKRRSSFLRRMLINKCVSYTFVSYLASGSIMVFLSICVRLFRQNAFSTSRVYGEGAHIKDSEFQIESLRAKYRKQKFSKVEKAQLAIKCNRSDIPMELERKETEKVFSTPQPGSWFSDLTLRQVDSFMKQINKNDAGSTSANKLKFDIIRQFKDLRPKLYNKLYSTEVEEFVKQFDSFSPDCMFWYEMTRDVDIPHYKFEKNNRIYMNSFFPESAYAVSKDKKKRDNVPILQNYDDGNVKRFVYDLVNKCCHKRNQLTIQKIKCILRSLVNPTRGIKKPYDEVLAIFERKTFLWKKNMLPLESQYSSLSWFVPYVQNDLFFVYCTNELKAFGYLHDLVSNLRMRLLAFVKYYYDVSELQTYERNQLKQKRIEDFKNILRAPKYQAMFESGMNRDKVKDMAYAEMGQKLDAISSDVITTNKETKKAKNAKTIAQARRVKWSLGDVENIIDDNFQIESRGWMNRIGHRLWAWWEGDAVDWGLYQHHAQGTIFDYTFKFDIWKCLLHIPLTIFLFCYSWSWWYWLLGSGILFAPNTFWKTLANFMAYQDAAASSNSLLESWCPEVENMIMDFSNFLKFEKMTQIPDSTKLFMVKVSAYLQVIYHLSYSNYRSALTASSTLFLAQPESAIRFIQGMMNTQLDVSDAVLVHVPNHIGQDYYVSVDTYASMVKEFNLIQENPEAWPAYYEKWRKFAVVEVESGGILKIVNFLTQSVCALGLDTMSKEELARGATTASYLRNMGAISRDAVEGVKELTSLLCRIFFGMDPFDEAFHAYSSQVIIYLKVTEKYVLDATCALKNDKTMIEALNFYTEGENLSGHILSNSLPHFMASKFRDRIRFMTDIATQCNTKLHRGSYRVEPLAIMFTGIPNSGKSRAMMYLMEQIVKIEHQLWVAHHEEGEEEPPKVFSPTMMCAYNPNDNFTEGYHCNKFFMFDEMFQHNDSEKKAAESIFFIKAVNSAPFCLNMASLANKGNVYFVSEYVFASTNMANNGFERTEFRGLGITDPQAFKRRNHIVVHGFQEATDEIYKCKFEIHKCKLHNTDMAYESVTGQRMYLTEIAQLIVANKLRQVKMQRSSHYDSMHLEQHQRLTKELRGEATENAFQFINFDAVATDGAHAGVIEIHSMISDMAKAMKWESTLIEIIRMGLAPWCSSPNLKYYIWLCGALMAAPLAASIYSALYAPDSKILQLLTVESFDERKKTGRPRKFKRGGYRQIKVDRMKRSGIIEPHSLDANFSSGLSNFSKCMLRVNIDAFEKEDMSGENKCYTQNGIHIRDGYILINAHFLLLLEPCRYYHIQLLGSNYNVSFTLDTDPIMIKDYDLAMFKIPKGYNIPKSGYEYLIPENKVYDLAPGSTIVRYGLTNQGTPLFSEECVALENCHSYTYNAVRTSYTIENPISYFSSSDKGDSGGAILVPGVQGKILLIGVHCGGSLNGPKKIGIGTPIDKEFIDAMIEQYSSFKVEAEEVTQIAPTEFEIHSDQVFSKVVEREVPWRWAHRMNRRSSLMRTKFNRLIPDNPYRPAVLEVTNGIDPYLIALEKLHQVPTKEVAFDDARVISYLEYLYGGYNGSRRILTYEESVFGIPGEFLGICAGTSPGYPYTMKGGHGKRLFIHFDNMGPQFIEKEFRDELDVYHSQLILGQQIEVLWADTLKVETREIEKVQACKTRLFTTCPLHFLILMRMYFMSMTCCVCEDFVMKPISVGITNSSLQWKLLYSRLQTRSNSIVAGDFSNYDGRVPKYIGELVLKFINMWYNDGPINARVRNLLFEHIYSATRIYWTKVYRVYDGNPSGNPFTSIYNSLTNLVMTFIVLTEDLGFTDKDFELAIYGDDNVIGVNRDGLTCEDFHPHYLRRFGMTYTHFSKTETNVTDTLESIRFLGRAFVPYMSVVLSPLKESVIWNSICYRDRDTNESEWLMSTLDSFVLEAFQLGLQSYRRMTRRLIEMVHEVYPRYVGAVTQKARSWYEIYATLYVKFDLTPLKPAKENSIEEIIPEVPSKFTQARAFFTQQLCRSMETDEDYALIERSLKRNFEILPSAPVGSKVDSDFQIESGLGENVDLNEAIMLGRQVVDLVTTQEFEIGKYQDEAEVIETNAGIIEETKIYKSLNFEKHDMSRVLNREYNVATLDWTTSLAIGNFWSPLNLPGNPLSEPFILDKIRGFKYFRCDMKVSVRVVANRFTYGKLMMGYVPYQLSYTEAQIKILTNLSGFNHRLLDANSGETVVMNIPFIWNGRYLDLDDSTQFDKGMGQIFFGVLNPLTSADGNATNAKVFITVQCLNAEVMWPIGTTTSSSLKNYVKSRVFKIESGKGTPISDNIKGIPRSDLRTVAVRRRGSQKVNTDVLITIPNSFRFMNSTKDKKSCASIASDQTSEIAFEDITQSGRDEMNLIEIVKTPSLIRFDEITSSDIGIPQLVDFIYDIHSKCFWSHIASMFELFSGSLKYMIYFTGSPLVTAELVIWLRTSDASDYENCYHQFVNVQGSCKAEFKVPYFDPRVMMKMPSWNDTSPTYPQVVISLLSWSQSDNVDNTPLWFNIYKAGDDDNQFGRLRDNKFVIESCPREDFIKDFAYLHRDMRPFHHRGLVAETIDHLYDIVQRETPVKLLIANTQDQSYVYQHPNTGSYCGPEIFGEMFLYYRGGIRLGHVTRFTGANACFFAGTDDKCISGVTLHDFGQNPFMQLQFPWLRGVLFNFTADPGTIQIKMSGSSAANISYYQFRSFASDFRFMHLCLPLRGHYEPVVMTDSVGTAGMISYFSA